MAYRAFHTNAESRAERQPAGERGPWLIACDGRLDNRDDLTRALGLNRVDPITDADLELAVCQRWGADGVSRMIGDFALAAWDERSRVLWLARDPAGTRPLFFHAGDGVVTWASDLNALVGALDISPDIDDSYIASYLAAEIDPSRSPFVGIQSVPPGALVRISSAGISTSRFWTPIPRTEIRYGSDAEYEEAFREVFREAVRCRLRADATVWSELSGGFDSSSIVVMADDLLRRGETETRVDTVSYVFDQSSLSNEVSYFSGVEEQRGRRGFHILESECPILAPLDPDLVVGGPSYLLAFAKRHARLCSAMKDAGARVLLCGHGGDNMLWSQPDAYHELADHLWARRLATLHRRTLTWSRALGRPYFDVLAKGALAPNLPAPVSRALGWTRPPGDLLAASIVHAQVPPHPNIAVGRRPSTRQQIRLLDIAIAISSGCYYRELGGIELTYPYLDRRVVEYVLAIPFDQIVRPGTNRSLHRRAFRQLLPESVQRRRGKRGLNEAFYRGLSRGADWWRATLANPHVARRGWVNAHNLRRELEQAIRGRSDQLYVLMKVLALEMWLRRLDRRANARHAAVS